MSDIKVVIQLLCQQLNLLLKVNLKTENFRLAKFNNNDESTIKELWATLKKLSKRLGATYRQGNDYPTQFEVQLFMLSRNYSSTEFYCLPLDNSSGSRELLLALMWLIASENTLSKLIFEQVRQSPLCQEYPEFKNEEHAKLSKALKFLSDDEKEKLSIEDKMNYCLWLANRVKYNLNKIHDLTKERINKTHKIHVATSGASGLPHLSVFETKLVHDPEFLKQYMPCLSAVNELLDAYAKWIKKRSVFWEWMDTVIDLKEKDVSNTSLQPHQEMTLVKFGEALHSYISTTTSEGRSDSCTAFSNIPRFFISSSFLKSTSTLMRKGSSSDLLSDIDSSENAVVRQASDLLTHLDTNLQDFEQRKIEKMNELHLSLRTLSEKLGVIVVNDSSSNTVETESEDCSK